MLVVRPAKIDDLDDIERLADQAGAGFTSLQVGREGLRAKLHRSEDSFAKSITQPSDQSYMLVACDSANNDRIVGLSAIKASVGQDGPYFNYKIMRMTQSSKDVSRHFDMETLILVNEYSGASEVGSLFVESSARGSGAGRLIAQARYMLMATAPERFSDVIISELRGQVGDDGTSVFWDAVGRPFFQMEFGEADRISAKTDNQFIIDLMPKHPIYVDLLPQAAREAIGKPHQAGRAAKAMLEAEGFHYDRMIDIFDGGPSMRAFLSDLRTVRDSRTGQIRRGEDNREYRFKALISNDDFQNYRCIYAPIDFDEQDILTSAESLKALGLSGSDAVRFWVNRS